MSLLYYLRRSASIHAEPPLVNSKKMNAFIRSVINTTTALGTGTAPRGLDHAVLQTVVHGDRCRSCGIEVRLMAAPWTDAVEEVRRFGDHVAPVREAGAEDAVCPRPIAHVLDELLEEADVVHVLLCCISTASRTVPALVVPIRCRGGPAPGLH